MQSILVINGPNLNLIGKRETELYGETSIHDIELACRETASRHDLEIQFMQSNHEGEIVEAIQNAPEKHGAILLNAGAYTHTSIAILDAIRAIDLPVVEVHLSNIHRREEFRASSYPARAAVGMICGFGATSYLLGITALSEQIGKPVNSR